MPQLTNFENKLNNDELIRICLLKNDLSGTGHTGTLNSSGDLATGAIIEGYFPFNYKENKRLNLKTSNINTKIQLTFKTCIEAVVEAIENYSDIISRENAIDDLRAGLLRLWEKRKEREKYFANLINTLNIILLKDEEEELNIDQLKGIKNVIKEASLLQYITKADIRDALKILHLSGCDVYKGLR